MDLIDLGSVFQEFTLSYEKELNFFSFSQGLNLESP